MARHAGTIGTQQRARQGCKKKRYPPQDIDMLHTPSPLRSRITTSLGLILGLAVLAGCAQQKAPGYYDAPNESTLTDAQQHAQGRRGARAPSQLQIGFGETPEERARQAALAADAAEAAEMAAGGTDDAVPRQLLEPKTFLGTVPCVSGEPGCEASRLTLTLAPSGEWRARIERADGPVGTPATAYGCWSVTGAEPLRIMLQTHDDATTSSFTFINDNVLRVNLYNDVRPLLDYRLTRQADIDPIDELASQPAQSCR